MAFQLQDNQQVDLAGGNYTDAAGNPATPPASVAFTSSDDTVLSVVEGGDGQTAVASAVGPLGTAQVQATATDEDGTTILFAPLDVEIIASDAVAGTIVPGTPGPKA